MKFSEFEGRPNQNTQQQAVTVTAVAKDLAALGVTLHKDTFFVLVQTENGDVRWACQTTPTASLGFLLREFNDPCPLSIGEASQAKFISPSGANVTLHVSQYVK